MFFHVFRRLSFVFAISSSPWLPLSVGWREIKPVRSRKSSDVYLTPWWRAFFSFWMYNSFILAICKGFHLRLCFLRCCVNAALYTLRVEINTAGHSQHMMSALEACDLSQRGRQHQAKWANITRPEVHINVISKCCINVWTWRLCSRLKRPKSEHIWIATAEARTDEFCSCVARNEAGASLRCYFSLCVCLWLLWNLKHFGKMCFIVLAFFWLMMLLL